MKKLLITYEETIIGFYLKNFLASMALFKALCLDFYKYIYLVNILILIQPKFFV